MKAIKFIMTMGVLLGHISLFYAQTSLDKSLENGTDFYTLGSLKISEDGRWSSVTKQFDGRNGTLMIFDSSKPAMPVVSIEEKVTFSSFTDQNRYLVMSEGIVRLINLRDFSEKKFQNAKQVGYLTLAKSFWILYNDGILSMFSSKGVKLRSVGSISKVITDNSLRIIGVRESAKSDKASETSFIDLSAENPSDLYLTGKTVTRQQLTDKGNFLWITEEDKSDKTTDVTLINLITGKKLTMNAGSSDNIERVEVAEVKDANSVWIDVWNRKYPEKSIPDIWYGNDGDLRAKHYGLTIVHDYYLWNENEEAPMLLKDKEFPVFAMIKRNDLVLASNPRVNFHYERRVPNPDLFLYDVRTGKKKLIFNSSIESVTSPEGLYLINSDTKAGKWFLYNVESNEKTEIASLRLKNPVFAKNNTMLYFDSDDGFYVYFLKSKELKRVKGTEGQKVVLQNYELQGSNSEYHVTSKTIDDSRPILIKMRDDDNRTSFAKYSKGKLTPLISESLNLISSAKFSSDFKTAFTVEENYNLSPQLVNRSVSQNRAEILHKSNAHDVEIKSIRQTMLEYKNSRDVKLKGLLYYPLNFDSTKKYPVIVNIYRTQRFDGNNYHYKPDDAGFDLRSFLRKGYFVYLPDIEIDSRGTGIAALDCVNAAVDAVENVVGVDGKRIGLMGHSMGGFETNFIATQSDRFVAYITGAGQGDVIRNYFSYSYHTYTPQTWHFENGQYGFGKSFAEDKQLYFRNNPIHYVDLVKKPILLWTGMKDENVKWEATMQFYIGLKRFNKNVIALFYKDGEHSFSSTPENRRDLTERIFEWWDYFLKDKRDVPWISAQIKEDAF